jgi:predicted transcriptional regulator
MGVRKQIQAITTSSNYKGPRAGYGEVDVLNAILAIGNSQTSVGRFKLGQIVGLGQGEIRTLIFRLKDANLISVDARGAALTEKGKREFDLIRKAIPYSSEVTARGLDLGGKYNWVVVVRNKLGLVKKGLEQRDAVIRAGASGALTVVYKSERFMIPNDDQGTDCEAMGPAEPWVTIRKSFELKDGDVVIVSGGSTLMLAQGGALSASLTIL